MDAAEVEGRIFIAGDPKVLLLICFNGNELQKSMGLKKKGTISSILVSLDWFSSAFLRLIYLSVFLRFLVKKFIYLFPSQDLPK